MLYDLSSRRCRPKILGHLIEKEDIIDNIKVEEGTQQVHQGFIQTYAELGCDWSEIFYDYRKLAMLNFRWKCYLIIMLLYQSI